MSNDALYAPLVPTRRYGLMDTVCGYFLKPHLHGHTLHFHKGEGSSASAALRRELLSRNGAQA